MSRLALRNSRRYNIISSILIFLLGGITNMVIFCTSCLDSPYLFSTIFWISFCYNGAAWTAYWKGSEFLVEFWNARISWIEAPVKRFFASSISIVIYVYIAVWGLDFFFDMVVFGMSWSETIEESGAPYVTTLLITLGINVIMHGRGFLLEWRQMSIDMEKLKTEQVFTQFQSLKNQVNPHFLFNSLNALSSLVYDDQAKAVEFIRKLSQVYRYVLDQKDEEVVPISDEIDFLKNFVFLQKIRFGDNLKFELHGEEAEGFLPPLALQLLVENAIKHNVVSETHNLLITVIIDGDYCEVSNNIREKLDKDSTGIGLNNLIARYSYISDQKVIIEKGTEQFKVRIPVLKFRK